MRISALETIRLDEFPNVLWVRLHTDEGLAGLGETFFGARAVEAWLHETAGDSGLYGDAPPSPRVVNRRIPLRVVRLLVLLRRNPPLSLVIPHPLDHRPPVPVHQPQAHQVTLQVELVVVLERGAVVQYRAVVE